MECNKCEDEIYPYQEIVWDDEENPYHEWCICTSKGGKNDG